MNLLRTGTGTARANKSTYLFLSVFLNDASPVLNPKVMNALIPESPIQAPRNFVNFNKVDQSDTSSLLNATSTSFSRVTGIS
jgi:hypothetical protein